MLVVYRTVRRATDFMADIRDNPRMADGTVAGARTAIQAAVAGLILHWIDSFWWEVALIPVATGLISVGFHLLSEFYPKLGKVFSAGLAEGAARYVGSKDSG